MSYNDVTMNWQMYTIVCCASCPQGWIGTSEGAASCTSCATGRYNSKAGAELESDCTPCVVNTYSAAIGATSGSVWSQFFSENCIGKLTADCNR